MKQMFRSVFALSIAGFLFSCNSDSANTKTDAAKTPADSSAATNATTAPAPTGPTVPFDVVTIYHTVKDYKTWRQAFDADTTRRNASGFTFVAVERAADKPDNVKIVLMASDLAKAKAFATDPGLKEAMDKAGVISKPDLKFWKIVRFNPENQKANGTRVEIVHKVKDFDTWLKGFDAEGPATRAANGMNDMVLGRGVDDPNMVHVVFDVTDIAKAKARVNDPALKKIMIDAGVIGIPTITFYTDSSK